MIKYIWIVILGFLFIHWVLYTIFDTIYVFKNYEPGYRFDNLEDPSQCLYIAIPATIFFYSLFSYFLL